MGLVNVIGNVIRGSSSIRKMSSDLLAKFLYLWSGKYSGDNLLSDLDSSVITVTGRDWTGSVIPDDSVATFAIPSNATYTTADEDGFWSGEVPFADLIAYDNLRTFIKYSDFEPFNVYAIGILKTGEVLTTAEKKILSRYFKLQAEYWTPEIVDGVGYFKDNVPIGSGRRNWTAPKADLIQLLDFSIDPTQKLLLDVSGEDNHAKLVRSNAFNGGATVSVISADPLADSLLCYDFSVEFTFSLSTTAGYQAIFGRTNGATLNSFLSAFICTTKLTYFSASGAANSQVDIIPVITANQVYTVKATVSNSTGRIDWTVDGVAGGADFANRTPTTNLSNEKVMITHSSYALTANGRIAGVKYYTSINYTDLSHYWPCAEGAGVILYDAVGSSNLTLNITAFGLQDEHHSNIINGFELYGDSGLQSTLIRVPIKLNGTLITPTISGYTKFGTCLSGAFHNFAETGVKRNYASVQALTDAGVSNTDIKYYGCISGSSGYSFCKNHMQDESFYAVYSSNLDRRSAFKYPKSSYYMLDTVTKVIVAGVSGKIHNTNIKNALNTLAGTISASIYYDYYVRNGIYTLTNATTDVRLFVPNRCGLIGQSKTGVIINSELAANTAKATIGAVSAIECGGINYRIASFTATAKNLRYVIHDDANATANLVKRIYDVSLQHFGNAAALAIDPTVWKVCDAYGAGVGDGLDLKAYNSTFEGIVTDGGSGRGFAEHYVAPVNNPTILIFDNCTFKSNGSYSFRWGTGPSTKKDYCYFKGCDFDGKQIYFDPSITYDPQADKVGLFKDPTDVSPTVYAATGAAYVGLIASTGIAKTLTLNTGTNKTLLFDAEKTLSAYSVLGTKNITDYIALTGEVGLKGLLGDCSSVNKTLVVKIDGVDTNIVFNQNYSAMTNAQALTSINAINADCQFSEYDYCANATVENI